MIILGLIGAKGAGKSTAFKLMKAINPEIVEIMLAKRLKETCASVFNLPYQLFDDPKLKERFLESPIYLSRDAIEAILISFQTPLIFDSYVRQHIGKILETPRRALQYIGTEVLRSINDDIHCESAMEDLAVKNVGVVTDIRFPNEKKYFEKNFNNFLMVYIKNTRAEKLAQADLHASEKHLGDLAKGALVIENESSMDDFERNLKTGLGSLLGP